MSWVKVTAIPLAAAGAAAAALLLASPAFAAGQSVSVSPSSNVKSGASVQVTGSGYTGGASIALIQCFEKPTAQTDCNVGGVTFVTATASGSISGSFKVMTGTIGSGTCKAGGTCYIEAANAAKTTEAAFTAFTFAGGATAPTSSAPSSSAPTSATPTATTSTTTTGGGAAPTAVDAGSGGNAGQGGNGVPDAVLVLAGVGAIAVGAGAWRLSRR